MDNIDFDFDLAEVSLDNNLPTIDDNYSDFSFDLKGGGSNNSEEVDLKTMKIENTVPEVELIDKPNLPLEEEEPKKIDVELVDEPMNSQPNNQIAEAEEVAKEPELTNSEVLQQLPIVRKDEEGVNPNLTSIDLDEDPGLLSNNTDENLESQKAPDDIVLNLDEDETGGPVISENLDETESLDTDKYLANLREEVNQAKLNTEVVEDFEEIRKINKMFSLDYDEYIVKLRDFFKLMNGRKRRNYEFSILENGNLIMIDSETNDSEELIIPKYTNVKNQIKENKLQIGTLLYNISSVRKSIYLDEKNKFYDKNSEKFAALTRDLSMLTKQNQKLIDYKDVVESKQLLEKNETLITEMKVNQAKQYLKIKEAKNDSSITYQQRYSLMLDFIKNNKLLMLAYENNRNYLDLDDSNYTICEKVEKSKQSKGKKSLKQSDDINQSPDIFAAIPPPNLEKKQNIDQVAEGDDSYLKFYSKSKAGNELSNFANLKVIVNGKEYKSGEHAFHGQKYLVASSVHKPDDSRYKELVEYSSKFEGSNPEFNTPLDAKKDGGKKGLPLDLKELKKWNTECEMVQLMICDYKYNNYESIKMLLNENKDKIIIHQDNRATKTTFWGAKMKGNQIIGKNKLGIIWQQVMNKYIDDSKKIAQDSNLNDSDSNFQEASDGESDLEIQEGEDQELNLQQLDENTVDKPNELNEIQQESSSKKPDIFDAQELDLGDDIEEYAPKFGENTGYPDTDLEDDDEQEEYKYNSSKKMTQQKKKEMEEQQKRDQEIPLNLDNEEPTVQEEEKKGAQNQPDEEANEPNMTEKEASKMLRKLNKKADENIKVIELNTDLSLTSKCDDSKTKRSSTKTTNTVNGKKSRKKNLDSELKNCVFPFKTMEGQGKGKKKKSVMNKQCISDGSGDICATERNEDCTIKKFGYCKK